MFWGAIDYDGAILLHPVEDTVNSEVYCEFIRTFMLPYFEEKKKLGIPVRFQQDGASSHTSTKTMEELSGMGITLFPHPSQSPDLNIIENLWSLLKKSLQNYTIRSREQLQELAIQEFLDTPAQYVRKLYESLGRRYKAVIRANGGSTSY